MTVNSKAESMKPDGSNRSWFSLLFHAADQPKADVKQVQAELLGKVLLPPAAEDEFHAFQGQLQALENELKNLAREARNNGVGNSVGISSRCARLAQTLDHILYLYRNNISALFQTRKPSDPAELLEVLAEFLESTLELLNRFQELPACAQDIDYDVVIQDLKTWKSSLDEFSSAGHNSRAIQTVLYQMVGDVGTTMERLHQDVIVHLTRVGIPRLRSMQKQTSTSMDNIATVAVLLASVAATMLQVAALGNPPQLPSWIATNICWYITLVSSITAAIASILGHSWTWITFRSVDYRPSDFLIFWIEKSPIVLLVIAVGAFFAGLAVFLFVSNQAFVTSILVTALAGTLCSLISLVACRFASKVWDLDPRHWLITPIWSTTTGKKNGQQRARHDIEKLEHLTHDDNEKEIRSMLAPADIDIHERARQNWRRFYLKALQLIPKGDQSFWNIIQTATRIHRSGLKNLRTVPKVFTFDGDASSHAALIKCVQFSPDGDRLLTASWDHTSSVVGIMKDELDWSRKRSTSHVFDSGLVHQAQWAPDGKYYFRLSGTGALTITEDVGDKIVNLRRPRLFGDPSVSAAAWVPQASNPSLVLLEDKEVVQLELPISQEGSWPREVLRTVTDFTVCGLSITKDRQWMICIGKRTTNKMSSSDYDHHKLDMNLYRIRVYKLKAGAEDHGTFVCDIPTYKAATYVALATDEKDILVSYGDNAHPQLWSITVTQNQGISTPSLRHVHTYLSKPKSRLFTKTPCIFAGPRDTFIMRAANSEAGNSVALQASSSYARTAANSNFGQSDAFNKSGPMSSDYQPMSNSIQVPGGAPQPGQIFCWDRETGTLLHTIDIQPVFGYISSLAWRTRGDSWMLAAGTLDGKLLVWDKDGGVQSSPEFAYSDKASSKDAISHSQESSKQGAVALSADVQNYDTLVARDGEVPTLPYSLVNATRGDRAPHPTPAVDTRRLKK